MKRLLIEKILREADRWPEGRTFELRLDVADIILRGLKRRRKSIEWLARRSGMSQRRIVRLMHSCIDPIQIEDIGKILWALGVHGEIQEKQP